jgi:C-terminal processing protease CtpA/Prc
MRKNCYSLILAAFFFFIIFYSLSIRAQEGPNEAFDPEKIFTPDQLKDDFAVFRDALEEGHGGLYRYTPKEELDRQFNSILKKLSLPLTETEFLRILAPLIANINDGHTGIFLSSSFSAYLENEPILFPFNLKFIDKKAYIFRNYSEDKDFAVGGEVLSIDNHPVSEILDKMRTIVPSDAHIEQSKYRRLESTARFGQTYNLLFGKTTSYTIVYRSLEDKALKKAEVKGIREKDLNSIFEERYPEAAKSLPPVELEHRDDIAILTIRTFGPSGYQSSGISYPLFMRNTFKELEQKNIQHLIIDLRNNGGGADLYGKILVAYLMDKPFMYYEHLRINNTEFKFLDHTDVPPERRTIPASGFRENDSGTYDLLGHPNLGEQKPIQPTFKGKVYILINGGGFSGTGECTSIIHFHKRAVFIGEECGAGYYGNTSGFMPTLTLPNTGIRVRIPVVRYTMAVSGYPPDRGIIPDYPVTPTINDLLNGKDAEMDFAIELIKKSK